MYGATLLTVAIIANAVLVGGLLALPLGNLVVLFRQQFKLTEPGERGLRAVFLAGLMAFFFVGGLLTDHLGVREVLIGGSLLAGFSIASLGVSRSFQSALVFTLLLGAATGLLHTAATVGMPLAFPELRPVPRATNLGFVFVGLGGLLLPYLVQFLVGKFSYRSGLLSLALVAVVPAFAAALTGNSAEAEPARAVNLGLLLADFRFWLALAAVFAIYGLESATLRWAPKYLAEIGLPEKSQLALWIFFWTIFLGARLASSTIHREYNFFWLIAILALVAAALIGNMSGMFRTRSGATSFLMLGGCLGPLFPTLAGVALMLFHQQPAVAFGLLCAAGTLGRLIVTLLADRMLAAGQVRRTMGLSALLGLVVFFPPLIWWVHPH